jgi:hypothetical protein
MSSWKSFSPSLVNTFTLLKFFVTLGLKHNVKKVQTMDMISRPHQYHLSFMPMSTSLNELEIPWHNPFLKTCYNSFVCKLQLGIISLFVSIYDVLYFVVCQWIKRQLLLKDHIIN